VQVSLATLATLGALSYFAQAGANSNQFTDNESMWTWVGIANLGLAVVVWSVVIARSRSAVALEQRG
jgi:hypothetical protein